MNETDFSAAALGQLVPTAGQHPITRVSEHAKAFVPLPIPRAIALSSDTLLKLEQGVAALSHLAGALDRRSINIELLLRPFKRREAIISSKIEGTVTTAERLLVLEAGGKPKPSADDAGFAVTREVLNHVKALDHAEAALEGTALGLRLITEMHEVLLSGGVRGEGAQPGRFRSYQNWIGTSECGITEATFVPPPPDRLAPLLDDLEKYIHEPSAPVLVRAAMVHYQFETIHPFGDGNGRIGRLLFALIPFVAGLTPRPMLYVSPFFERHRDAYTRLLYRVSTSGEVAPWINFFLDAVIEETKAMTMKVGEVLDLRNEFDERVRGQRGASSMLHGLIDLVMMKSVFSSSQAREHLKANQQTTAYSIKRLAELGIISRLKEVPSREHWYYCPRLIAMMR